MVEISSCQKKLIFSSYLCEFLLLLIFLSNNFDFICNNNKQLYFVKMHLTMRSEYFFVSNSINKFVEVTARDKQLLKFCLFNANFIHANIFLYTNSYTNFATRELCLRNGLAGINCSVQWENKLTLLHKNFDFSKNAVRDFYFILGYTIFRLTSIVHKSFEKKSRLIFPF